MIYDHELLPFKVTIYITNHCRFNCEYCFFTDRNLLNTESMNLQQLQKLVAEFKKYGVSLVSIAGGEPLLNQHFLDLVTMLSEAEIYPVVATNAIGFSKDYYQQIKNAGIRYLQIGIDSLSDQKNHNFKCENHFSQCVEAIKTIQEVGIHYGIATCVSKENLTEMFEITNFALTHGALVHKLSFYHGDLPKFKITEAQKKQVLASIRTFNKNHHNNFIKIATLPETINFISKLPNVIIHSNGEMEVNRTIIGNSFSADTGRMYQEYLNNTEIEEKERERNEAVSTIRSF